MPFVNPFKSAPVAEPETGARVPVAPTPEAISGGFVNPFATLAADPAEAAPQPQDIIVPDNLPPQDRFDPVQTARTGGVENAGFNFNPRTAKALSEASMLPEPVVPAKPVLPSGEREAAATEALRELPQGPDTFGRRRALAGIRRRAKRGKTAKILPEDVAGVLTDPVGPAAIDLLKATVQGTESILGSALGGGAEALADVAIPYVRESALRLLAFPEVIARSVVGKKAEGDETLTRKGARTLLRAIRGKPLLEEGRLEEAIGAPKGFEARLAKGGRKFRQAMMEASLEGWEAPNPKLLEPEWRGNWLRKAAVAVGNGVPSYGVAIAATILTKNPGAGAAILGGVDGLSTYTSAVDAGVAPRDAAILGLINGAWTTVTERVPFEVMLGGAGRAILRRIATGATTEGIQELIQTVGTNAIERYGFDEGRKLTEGWLEALVAGGVLGGVGGAAIRNSPKAQKALSDAMNNFAEIAGVDIADASDEQIKDALMASLDAELSSPEEQAAAVSVVMAMSDDLNKAKIDSVNDTDSTDALAPTPLPEEGRGPTTADADTAEPADAPLAAEVGRESDLARSSLANFARNTGATSFEIDNGKWVWSIEGIEGSPESSEEFDTEEEADADLANFVRTTLADVAARLETSSLEPEQEDARPRRRSLIPTQAEKARSIIARGVFEGRAVSAKFVQQSGQAAPEGYTRQGDLFVPPAQKAKALAKATPKTAPAALDLTPETTDVVAQPVGLKPTVNITAPADQITSEGTSVRAILTEVQSEGIRSEFDAFLQGLKDTKAEIERGDKAGLQPILDEDGAIVGFQNVGRLYPEGFNAESIPAIEAGQRGKFRSNATQQPELVERAINLIKTKVLQETGVDLDLSEDEQRQQALRKHLDRTGGKVQIRPQDAREVQQRDRATPAQERAGGLSEDEANQRRLVQDLAPVLAEQTGDRRLGQVDFSPELARSPEFEATKPILAVYGLTPLAVRISECPFNATIIGNYVLIEQDTLIQTDVTVDQVARHEAFHWLIRQTNNDAIRLRTIVDPDTDAFKLFKKNANAALVARGYPALTDGQIQEEIAGEYFSGVDTRFGADLADAFGDNFEETYDLLLAINRDEGVLFSIREPDLFGVETSRRTPVRGETAKAQVAPEDLLGDLGEAVRTAPEERAQRKAEQHMLDLMGYQAPAPTVRETQAYLVSKNVPSNERASANRLIHEAMSAAESFPVQGELSLGEIAPSRQATDTPVDVPVPTRILTGGARVADYRAAFAQGQLMSSLVHKVITEDIPAFDVRGQIIQNAQDFVNLLMPLRSPYFESMKVAFLDAGNKVLASKVSTVGLLDAALVSPRSIFRGAPEDTVKVLVAHNHPSGDAEPSTEDKAITGLIQTSAEQLGIEIADHIITDGSEYYSFATESFHSIPGAGKAAFERVPRKSLRRITPLSHLTELISELRQDADVGHVIYLSSKNRVQAIERFPLSMRNTALRKMISSGIPREGTAGLLIDYPVNTTPRSQKVLQHIVESAHTFNVSVLDIATLDKVSLQDEGLLPRPKTRKRRMGLLGEKPQFSVREGRTVITPEQDATYMAAVESGDLDTAQRIVDNAAKTAGYDTKGFHGTDFVFTRFEATFAESQRKGYYGKGFYFSDKRFVADTFAELTGRGGQNVVINAYLRMDNPWITTPAAIGATQDFKSADEIAEYAKEQGYDGIQVTLSSGHKEHIVFDSNQIKSSDAVTRDDAGNVIPLSQRFQVAEEDLRYSVRQPQPGFEFQNQFEEGFASGMQAGQRASVSRDQLARFLKDQRVDINTKQREVKKYATSMLPPAERRQALTAIEKISRFAKEETREKYVDKAMALIDKWANVADRRLAKITLTQKVAKEYKRLNKIQGKTKSTVALSANRALREYLDSISVLPSNRIKKLERALAHFEQSPNDQLPPQLEEQIANLFRANINEMTPEQMREAVNEINRIKRLGKLKFDLQRAQLERTLARQVARAVERVKKIGRSRPQGSLETAIRGGKRRSGFIASFLLIHSRAERIAAWLDGQDTDGPIVQNVLDPLLKSVDNELVGLENALDTFRDIHKDIDIFEAISRPVKTITLVATMDPETDEAFPTKKEAQAELRRRKIETIKRRGKEIIKGDLRDRLNESNRAVPAKGGGYAIETKVHLTLDQMMFIYANSLNDANRAHLIGTGFIDDMIDDIVAELPAEAKKAVDDQIKHYDDVQWKRMSDVFARENNVDLTKELFYFPIMNLDTSRAENAIMNDLAARYSSRHATLQKGQTKSRIGSKAAFSRMSYFQSIVRNMALTEHYIAFNDAVRGVNAFLQNPQVKAAIEARSPRAYQELTSMVRDVAHGRLASAETAIGKASDILRTNFITSVLWGNLVTAQKQLPSFAAGLARVKKRYALESIAAFAKNPKKQWDFAREKSVMMRNRAHNIQREMAEIFERELISRTLGVRTNIQKLREFGFKPIQISDGAVTTMLWIGRYNEVLAKTGDEERAISEADRLIRTTQPAARLIDLPSVMRVTGVARAFSTFKNQPNQYANMLGEQFSVYKGLAKTSQELFWLAIVAPTLFFWLTRGYRNPFKDPKGLARTVVSNFTSGFVGSPMMDAIMLGITGEGRANQFKINFTPSSFNSLEDLAEAISLTDEQRLVASIAQFAGVPYTQVARTWKGIDDFKESKDPRDLIWSQYALGKGGGNRRERRERREPREKRE